MIDALLSFAGRMLQFSLVAVFLENIIFSRALGSSTVLYIIRNKMNYFVFSFVLTIIMLFSSLSVYGLTSLLGRMRITIGYSYTPIVYITVIAVVYIATVLIVRRFFPKWAESVLSMIHLSALNCSVLGAILISAGSDMDFAGHIGFGIGMGIGFLMAVLLLAVAHKHLNSEFIPKSFRGFPITLIYIGIISMAFYGLIGQQLPR